MKQWLKEHCLTFILSCVIFLLVIALTASCIILNDKSSRLKDAEKKIDSYSSTIKENEDKIKKSEEEIKNKQAEIDSAKAENEELKKQNIELAAKKKAAAEAAKKQTATAVQKSPSNTDVAQIERTNQLIVSMSLERKNVAPPIDGVCYLTFDDGPSSKVTPRILDILAKYNVKATFFVAGTGNLSLLPRMVAEGHTIGLHTNTHNCYVKNSSNIYSSVENYLLDLKAISDKVEATVGIRSAVIRFPGGSSNKVSKVCPGIMTTLTKLMPDMGYSYFDWNVLSGDADSDNVPAETIVNNVLSRAKNKKSICVLMHDTNAKSTTADALEQVIIGLSGMGFRFEVLTPETYGYHQTVIN